MNSKNLLKWHQLQWARLSVSGGDSIRIHSVYKDSLEEGFSRDWCTCECRGNRLGSGLVPRWSITLCGIANLQPEMAERSIYGNVTTKVGR